MPWGTPPRRRGEGEEAANPAPLRFDEYDYETDDSKRHRYYEADGKKVYFTDIACLRSHNGQLWYDYWELTGAKMWITNGRMAGVMCLYAKTEEGVTAFMVDRHAEGLFPWAFGTCRQRSSLSTFTPDRHYRARRTDHVTRFRNAAEMKDG